MAKKKKSSNQLEVQNAAKTLFANIRFMSVDNPIHCLVITSSVPNEGKSTASVNLAQAIATSGKRVLLVEADMRRRSLANMLGARAASGVYAVLSDAVPLREAVVATSTPNLFFLDSEPNIPNPADMISSKRYRRLVRMLAEHYDYVIFDTPPVGTFVDAAILSTLADATVLIARPNHVKRAELEHAYEQLQKADANVVGICATDVEGSGSEYYYAYYTNSGERVKDSSALPAPGASSMPLPSNIDSSGPIAQNRRPMGNAGANAGAGSRPSGRRPAPPTASPASARGPRGANR